MIWTGQRPMLSAGWQKLPVQSEDLRNEKISLKLVYFKEIKFI